MLAIFQAAGWPIWFLLFASIVAVALIVERLITLRREKILPRNLLDEVIRVHHTGKATPDVINKLEQNSPLGTVLAGEPLIAEAYLLAPEQGPEASDLAVGLVLATDDVTPTTLVALVRRLADALGTAPDVPHSLDVAVLTEEQRAAARVLGPPVHVALEPNAEPNA